jgi:hypothetical protein
MVLILLQYLLLGRRCLHTKASNHHTERRHACSTVLTKRVPWHVVPDREGGWRSAWSSRLRGMVRIVGVIV